MIRYVVNIEELKSIFENIINNSNNSKVVTGKEYSKGFMLNEKETYKEFTLENINQEKIIVTEIILGTTENTYSFSPDSNIDIFLENIKTKSRKPIFQSVYLSDLYKIQKFYAPLSIDYRYKICMQLNDCDKYTNVFIDITYSIPEE